MNVTCLTNAIRITILTTIAMIVGIHRHRIGGNIATYRTMIVRIAQPFHCIVAWRLLYHRDAEAEAVDIRSRLRLRNPVNYNKVIIHNSPHTVNQRKKRKA